jgi:hypothetical protein
MAAVEAELDPARMGSFARLPPRPHVLKRRCIECGAFLSRYNRSEKYCFNHEPSQVKRFIW